MDDGTGNVIPLYDSNGTGDVRAEVTVVARGDRGDAVRALQTKLTSWGISPGPIDGIFGSKTEEAVRALQRKLGASVTGAYDEETQNAVASDLYHDDSILNAAAAAYADSMPESSTAIVPITAGASGASPAPAAESGGFLAKNWHWLVGGGLALLALYVLKSDSRPAGTHSIAEIEEALGEAEPEEDIPAAERVVEVAAEKPKKARRGGSAARDAKGRFLPRGGGAPAASAVVQGVEPDDFFERTDAE